MTQQTLATPIFTAEMEVERYLILSLFNRNYADYYPAMAQIVIDSAWERWPLGDANIVADVGCGIGMSTRELLDRTSVEHLLAVDSSPAMLRILKMGFLGDSRVNPIEGRAEELSKLTPMKLDAIFYIQMIHLLHKNEAESKVPEALAAFSRSLRQYGLLAMDFGPSNGFFTRLKLADPRMGPQSQDEVMTELSHPLYRAVMDALPSLAKARGMEVDSFWPAPATRMNQDFLMENLRKFGFADIQTKEVLHPMSGEDVWNQICLGLWTVAKRWLPMSNLTFDQFFQMLEEAIKTVRNRPDFDELIEVAAVHPSLVVTAIRE